MNVLLLEPPAKTSNEFELWRALPDSHVTVVSDRCGWAADACIPLPSRRIPILGRENAWTAALVWLRGLETIQYTRTPDVVVSLELYSIGTWQAAALASRLGVPHVVHVAETLADSPLYSVPPYRVITRRAGLRADGYICITERAKQHAIQVGCPPELCHVVHLAVDMSEFSPARSGLTPEPVVTYLGQLRADRGADKGVAELCDAVDMLVPSIPDIRLRLIGDGRLRRQFVRRASTEEHLSVERPVPRWKVPEMLRASRVLALPSKQTWKWEEQFGFVLVEAMACGLPVVATSSGAIPEIVPPRTPLAPEGDVGALARAIQTAVGPSGDELGHTNRQWAQDRYCLGRQAGVLWAALDQIL